MTTVDNHDCRQCGASPGQRHLEWDDLARCRSTGDQLIQCEGELHVFDGREYGEHDGPCGPDVWDGEYPGTKECREYGLYFTDGNGVTREDLNTLAVTASWDASEEKYIIPQNEPDFYAKF